MAPSVSQLTRFSNLALPSELQFDSKKLRLAGIILIHLFVWEDQINRVEL